MKRLTLALCLLFTAQILSAQKAFSILDSARTWTQTRWISDGETPDRTVYLGYRIGGDTLIDGGLYRRLLENDNTLGGLREEDNRLLYQPIGGQLDTLLDFNLAVGDTFLIEPHPFMPQFMVLQSRDSVVTMDGLLRERLNFMGFNAGFDARDFAVSWIDGIGSTRGILPATQCSVGPGFGNGRSGASPICYGELACAYGQGEALYENFDDPDRSCEDVIIDGVGELIRRRDVTIFPNPTRGQLTVRVPGESNNWSLRLVDQLGRTVRSVEQVRVGEVTLVGGLPTGVYWLRLRAAGWYAAEMVVVE